MVEARVRVEKLVTVTMVLEGIGVMVLVGVVVDRNVTREVVLLV